MTAAQIYNRKYRPFPLICLAISTFLLLVGLWPFDFFPGNNVRRLSDRNGLRFDRNGIVIGKEPVYSPGGDIDFAKPWTVVLEVTPHEEPSDSLPRILSAFDSDGRELLILAQWRSGLVLRILQGERFFRLKYMEIGVNVLRRGETRSIALSADNAALSLFADGILVRTIPPSTLSFLSSSRPHARLALGNSPAGDSPWRGDILALSISPQTLAPDERDAHANRAMLQYRFDERSGTTCRGGDPRYDLTVPAVFRAPKKGVLTPPWKVQRYDRSFWKDVVVNLLGFIPLGFAVSAWLWNDDDEEKRRSRIVTAVLLGGAVSLAIELLQVYLPTRDSSLTDLMNNILGTWIGVLLFRAARRVLYR